MKRISSLECAHSQNCEESEEYRYQVGFVISSNAGLHGNWQNAFKQICINVNRKDGILHYIASSYTHPIASSILSNDRNRMQYNCQGLTLEKRLEVMQNITSAKNASYIFLTKTEEGAAVECYKKFGHLSKIHVLYVDEPYNLQEINFNIDFCLCTMVEYPKILSDRLARLYVEYGKPANYVVHKRCMVQAPRPDSEMHVERLIADRQGMTTYYSRPVVDYFNVLFISTVAFDNSKTAQIVLRHAISCLQRRRKDVIIHCVKESFIHENVRNINESHIRAIDCSQEYTYHTEEIDHKKEVELIWQMAEFVHEMNFFDDPSMYFNDLFRAPSKQPSVMDIIQDVKVKSGEKKFNLNVYNA